ncbi:MAG: 50S ribosomal protein L17 [Candidatus Pacebacteria bacterium]|jgi:large subunit ribosomal protein L17|nr:50S ribosomal protein L17 [bacterium]MDP6527761.1 50S ribosomal protein L17 [Candidatus Paceibacterota bacterium]MDP6659598.1 50S ribosomal protein L17 [Candidatus Paceibacterota bacterium]|tara:strand:- start:30963 stop:31316 length:354 start_codon:yes stop_codon:yes gene_type:complete
MKHHKRERKFGRVARQRTALLRSLARSLILHGKIETTEAKAKELRPFIEKLVTMGNKKTLASRRMISSRLGEENLASKKLVDEIAPKYKDREGGYTRITKTGVSGHDARKNAVIEFV